MCLVGQTLIEIIKHREIQIIQSENVTFVTFLFFHISKRLQMRPKYILCNGNLSTPEMILWGKIQRYLYTFGILIYREFGGVF